MPFGLGFGELLLIFAVLLMLFGAKRLPEVAARDGERDPRLQAGPERSGRLPPIQANPVQPRPAGAGAGGAGDEEAPGLAPGEHAAATRGPGRFSAGPPSASGRRADRSRRTKPWAGHRSRHRAPACPASGRGPPGVLGPAGTVTTSGSPSETKRSGGVLVVGLSSRSRAPGAAMIASRRAGCTRCRTATGWARRRPPAPSRSRTAPPVAVAPVPGERAVLRPEPRGSAKVLICGSPRAGRRRWSPARCRSGPARRRPGTGQLGVPHGVVADLVAVLQREVHLLADRRLALAPSAPPCCASRPRSWRDAPPPGGRTRWRRSASPGSAAGSPSRSPSSCAGSTWPSGRK